MLPDEAEERIGRALAERASSLNLRSLELTRLPESLGQLTQLTELDVSGNQLTSLPEWLGQLTHLLWLHVRGNQLTRLPESLGQLTQLTDLAPSVETSSPACRNR